MAEWRRVAISMPVSVSGRGGAPRRDHFIDVLQSTNFVIYSHRGSENGSAAELPPGTGHVPSRGIERGDTRVGTCNGSEFGYRFRLSM